MTGRIDLPNATDLQYVQEAQDCITSLKKNEDFDYELTTHDYKKLSDLMAFPTKAFKMGIREKYVTFRPMRGQIVRSNLGITIGSVLQGCKYGVVVQTNYKNKTSPTIQVAPIHTAPKKTPYLIPIQESMFETINAPIYGYIHIDQARPCSVGSFIADDSGNYVYGNLNEYGLGLLKKPILRLWEMLDILDLKDNKRTKNTRTKNWDDYSSTRSIVTSEGTKELPILPEKDSVGVKTTNEHKSSTNSKKNKKKKKQKARKKKR